MRTELGRSQVEVQRCALSSGGPRLRSTKGLIKSNNSHLAGGEQYVYIYYILYIIYIFLLFKTIYIYIHIYLFIYLFIYSADFEYIIYMEIR